VIGGVSLAIQADVTLVNKPQSLAYQEIHKSMIGIVTRSLDSDITLLPKSAQEFLAEAEDISTTPIQKATTSDLIDKREPEAANDRDPDDFSIMSEKQAKRIASLCEMTFGVELSVDVVIAEANVGRLCGRVLGAMSLDEGDGDGMRTR
jgi:hypothetical protein